MDKKIITYKGLTIELGELSEPRKGYWKPLDMPFDTEPREVECGSWEDLERIAKRSIDAATERQ